MALKNPIRNYMQSIIDEFKHKQLGQFLILLFLFFLGAQQLSAQGPQAKFGKNRVQYNEFVWNFYETDNFIIYYYQGGQELARYAMKVAENKLRDIENQMEYSLSEKIELMVYHNVEDLRQTNIGAELEVDNTGGLTQIIGNKVFIYFNGDHNHLENQIVHGMATVHFESMVFGSGVQEIIQNAVLLNLPDWYVDGLIAYIADSWNVELDNRLRNFMKQKKYRNFKGLSEAEAEFAGHALWHYIAQNYGSSSIPNILYLTRINRSVDNGFQFVLGNGVNEIIEEWWLSIQDQYDEVNEEWAKQYEGELIYETKKRWKDCRIDNITLSPNGENLVYSTNEKGLIKVFVENVESGKRKKLLKTGFKSFKLPIGSNYPYFSWNKKGNKIAIVYQKRDAIQMQIHDLNTGESEKHAITKFQQILGVSFTNDDRRVIFSAVQRGQADLFSYFIPNTRVRQLTKDVFDDLYPQFMVLNGREGVAFSSNRYSDELGLERIDTIIPDSQFDLYFYDLQREDDPLVRLTKTAHANERYPVNYNEKYVAFLSDENGIRNRYVAGIDSFFVQTDQVYYFQDSTIRNPEYEMDSLALTLIDSTAQEDKYDFFGSYFPITDVGNSIVRHDISRRTNKVIDLLWNDGIYQIYAYPKVADVAGSKKNLKKTDYSKELEKKPNAASKRMELDRLQSDLGKEKKKKKKVVLRGGTVDEDEETVEPIDSSRIDVHNYYFQSEFDVREQGTSSSGQSSGLEEDRPTANSASDEIEDDYIIFAGDTIRRSGTRQKVVDRKARNYAPKFAVDHLAATLDNSVQFSDYKSYQLSAASPNFFDPNFDLMIKLGVSDLFEDYKIVGGFRLPTSDLTSGMEYFIEYQNLKKRLDKKFLYYRKAERQGYRGQFVNADFNLWVKNITNYAQYTMTYPLDIIRSFRLHLGYRSEKLVYLSNDELTIALDSERENWVNSRFEYVHDATQRLGVNLLSGLRFRLYVEFHKKFEANINDSNFKVDFKDTGNVGSFGGDFRHYQKIYRKIIWANRFTFAKSFGSQRINYYLGAVDNWLTIGGNSDEKQDRRFNGASPVDMQTTYAFQSLVPNLRGFRYNIRNGSNYLLLNSELRVPIFSSIINRPMRSEFLRNFMMIGFVDVGTAWEKGTPFSSDNRYYTYVYETGTPENPIVSATVRYFKDPIVYGYGMGWRTTLAGYYLRVDLGWGVDSGTRGARRTYISLGTDF